MSNSKDNEKTSSKSSFNKSKSKSISSAMDDLEMGKPISKNLDLEVDNSKEVEGLDFETGLEESSNHLDDLETVPEIEDAKSDKYDDLSSFLDEDEEDLKSDDLEIANNNVILDDSDDLEMTIESELGKYEDLNVDDEIFISPNKTSESLDLDEPTINEEENPLIDDELILARPAKKSKKDSKFSKFISKPKDSNKSSKNSKKSSKKFKFSVPKLFGGEKLSTPSKIFALFGLILGIGIIIDGLISFVRVSDRVIDNVLLGEAGSWSIIIIFIGLIIIFLDVFFIFYYKKSLSNSNIKNAQIRSTFDTLDKIKSIDSDYYQESNDSLFKDLLKTDEESSENNLKTSTFKGEEIYVDQSVRDLDGLNSVGDEFDDINVSDSNSIDSFNNENSIFEIEDEKLSDSVDDFEINDDSLSNPILDDLEVVPKIEDVKSDKYDDLSSFLDDEDDEDLSKSEFKKSVDIDSIIKESKPKSTQDEDLAAKKARIIEGTNFDNSLRKSKK